LGVGFLGAGPVTQAIHLPTLARLGDRFHVAHVTDIDAGIAVAVAARVGARWSTSTEELLADPAVDVVAICSPPRFHAEQVIAACSAGVKAVLCEKPFATSTSEAEEIAQISQLTSVPILVGARHTFEPGWLQLQQVWGDFPSQAHTIRSSIVLPPNSRFEDFATEVLARPDLQASDLDVAATAVQGGVMGLAIHDLPLVRTFLTGFSDLQVLSAQVLSPFGYRIALHVGGKFVELHAGTTQTWRPEWTLEAWSEAASMLVDFAPSYVHAGSARATFAPPASLSTRIFGSADANG